MGKRKVIWTGVYQHTISELLVTEDDKGMHCEIRPVNEGLLHNIAKGAMSFAKAHPFITGWAAAAALDSLRKYNEAKKQAIHFYAKDMPERIKYTKMVKEMEKNGYRVVKSGYKGGSEYFWELHRR